MFCQVQSSTTVHYTCIDEGEVLSVALGLSRLGEISAVEELPLHKNLKLKSSKTGTYKNMYDVWFMTKLNIFLKFGLEKDIRFILGSITMDILL